MKKSDYQLDEVKKIELDILKEFIRICELLHLRYFAIDGTALGLSLIHIFYVVQC